jgi:hypothetical protein
MDVATSADMKGSLWTRESGYAAAEARKRMGE